MTQGPRVGWTVAILAIGLVARGSAFQAKWHLEGGEQLPKLLGKHVDGKPFEVDWTSQRPVILYVVAPFTTYVDKNDGPFLALARQVQERYDVIVWMPEPEKRANEYANRVKASSGGLRIDVLVQTPEKLVHELYLGAFPQTIVSSAGGRVLRNFMGAYDDRSFSAKPAEIEAFFKVVLPKL